MMCSMSCFGWGFLCAAGGLVVGFILAAWLSANRDVRPPRDFADDERSPL